MRKPKKRIKAANTKRNEVCIDIETNHLHQWWDEPCATSPVVKNLVDSNLKDMLEVASPILENIRGTRYPSWMPSMINQDDMYTKSFEDVYRTAFPRFDFNNPWFGEIKSMPANREARLYTSTNYYIPDDFDRTPKEFGLDEHLADKMFLYSDWEYLPLPEGKPKIKPGTKV